MNGTKPQEGACTDQEAMFGILMGAAYGTAPDEFYAGVEDAEDDEDDSLCSTKEIDRASLKIRRMRLFEAQNDTEDLQQLHRQFLERLFSLSSDEDPESLRMAARELSSECAKALDLDLHGSAFAHSCDILMADGHLTMVEEEFLRWLEKELEIDSGFAQDVREFTAARNRA